MITTKNEILKKAIRKVMVESADHKTQQLKSTVLILTPYMKAKSIDSIKLVTTDSRLQNDALTIGQR